MLCGPLTWRIAWEAPDDGAFGDTDTYDLLIRVRPGMPADLERETLMHEVLHACYRTAGIDSTIAREEQIVSGVSPFLLDALRRSPDLAAYLLAPHVVQSARRSRGGDRE